MAKYDVAHACGHSHTHSLAGPGRARERRLERLAGEDCPACESAAWEARRAAAAAAGRAAAAGLPALTGTERQVGWAVTLRDGLVGSARPHLALHPLAAGHPGDPAADLTLVGAVADHLEEDPDGAVAAGLAADVAALARAVRGLRAYAEVVGSRTAAGWWIDRRGCLGLGQLPALLVEERLAAEAKLAAEIQAEARAAELAAAVEAVRAALAGTPEFGPERTAGMEPALRPDYGYLFLNGPADLRFRLKDGRFGSGRYEAPAGGWPAGVVPACRRLVDLLSPRR